MHNTDRKAFDDQLAVLFGGFPTFLTPPRIEAYWRGLQKMPLATFVRCVDYALGESGTDKLPTVNALWQISRNLRAPAAPQRHADTAPISDLQRVANGAFLRLLNDKGAVSEQALAKILAVKNKIVSEVPADADHGELRAVLIAAFEKLWEPMPQACIDALIERKFPPLRTNPQQSDACASTRAGGAA